MTVIHLIFGIFLMACVTLCILGYATIKYDSQKLREDNDKLREKLVRRTKKKLNRKKEDK